MSGRFSRVLAVSMSFLAGLLLMLIPADSSFAHVCWFYADNMPATLEMPWIAGCDGTPDPGVGLQLIREQHRNWHCTFPSACNSAWGAAFIGFHRQFILDFDIWRINNGYDRLETWDPEPGGLVPGDDETLGTAFTHCNGYSGCGGTVRNVDRIAGAACDGCSSLAPSLIGDNLADFATLGEVGAELECTGWHGDFHCGAQNAGCGTGDCGCTDVGGFLGAPRDPAFWMGHKKLDALARDWQRMKACDLVIVIDRSGSMNDNCNNTVDCSGPNDPGDTDCKLNAAKEAAKLLADLLADANDDGSEHRVGLVSFANTATMDMGLQPAAGIVSDDGLDNTLLETALGGIQACGGTSIGAGIDAAITMLGAGSNPHQAILLLTDGLENVNPLIADVAGSIGAIQVCAVGFGEGAREDNLRTVAEEHGGIFIAEENLTTISLEKFFVDCFGQIFDEAISEDPVVVLPAGQVASQPFSVSLCGSAARVTFVLGRDPVKGCDLRLIIHTPMGNLVDLNDPAVEVGSGPSWNFVRIKLPYHGEVAGAWTGRAIRPQRVFTHGFATDAFANLLQGINLAREEIHRLCPDGCQSVLYYEDGSATGNSAYRIALQQELAAGTIASQTIAVSPADFNSKLLQQWDLIVFARQVNPTTQVYDTRLQNKICQGQRALLTDFYSPVGGANQILLCAGTLRGQRVNYTQIIGDGRLVAGIIPLVNPGYPIFSFEVNPATGPGIWLAQAFNNLSPQTGSIIGVGSSCPSQTFFYSTLSSELGRVEAISVKPRVLIGQKILATFRLTESNRPVGDWDSVSATVTLQRPTGAPEVYQLRDDGTNGDRLAYNNYWSAEIPTAASAEGPHKLSATFFLTKGGCTVRREAEYSVIVQRSPQVCKRMSCVSQLLVAAGEAVVMPTCAQNLCVPPTQYQVTVTDTKGWLCTLDTMGMYMPIPSASFTTDFVPGGEGICFNDEVFPIFVCIPPGAPPNESTFVTYTVNSPQSQPIQCTTEVIVDTGVDCNQNGAPDTTDIRNGTSADTDGNGVPDECGAGCLRPAVQWVHSVANHRISPTMTAPFFLDLDLTGNPATRTSEPRDSGIRILEVQFDRDIVSGSIAIRNHIGHVASGPLTLLPGANGPTSLGRLTLASPLPNAGVYRITVMASAGTGCDMGMPLCAVALVGDFNSDGAVTAADKGAMLGFMFQPITQLNARYDLQVNGSNSGMIGVLDLGAWTGFFGTTVQGEGCPGSGSHN